VAAWVGVREGGRNRRPPADEIAVAVEKRRRRSLAKVAAEAFEVTVEKCETGALVEGFELGDPLLDSIEVAGVGAVERCAGMDRGVLPGKDAKLMLEAKPEVLEGGLGPRGALDRAGERFGFGRGWGAEKKKPDLSLGVALVGEGAPDLVRGNGSRGGGRPRRELSDSSLLGGDAKVACGGGRSLSGLLEPEMRLKIEGMAPPGEIPGERWRESREALADAFAFG
jgi:hypothetical protein